MEGSFQAGSHPLSNYCTGNDSILKLRILNLENGMQGQGSISEIGIIFNQIQRLKQKNINKNFLKNNLRKKVQLSTTKLCSYQSEVQSILQKTKQHQELQNMREIIAQKKQALGDLKILFDTSSVTDTNDISQNLGFNENEIQSEIRMRTQNLYKIKTNLLASLKELEVQITSVKEEELQIEQTIKIIHKRNAAQLLRLKRLINEAQLREQYWSA